MANDKLIQELIIDIKQKGAKNVEKSLKRINQEAEDFSKLTKGKMPGSIEEFEKLRKKMAGVGEQSHGLGDSVVSMSRDVQAVTSKLAIGFGAVGAAIGTATAAMALMGSAAKDAQLDKVAGVLGKEYGSNIKENAKQIQSLTGYTLTYTEALRQTTKAAAFGITGDQLKNLTKIARNASMVMGTELPTSLQDLVEGVAKSSTEITDNLGLTVRVGDANEAYAKKLGKTVSSLTAYERQQAYTNATISQGIARFGALNDVAEPTNISKLAGVIKDDLNKSLMDASKYAEGFAGILLKIYNMHKGAGSKLDIVKGMESSLAAFKDTADPKSLKESLESLEEYKKLEESLVKAEAAGKLRATAGSQLLSGPGGLGNTAASIDKVLDSVHKMSKTISSQGAVLSEAISKYRIYNDAVITSETSTQEAMDNVYAGVTLARVALKEYDSTTKNLKTSTDTLNATFNASKNQYTDISKAMAQQASQAGNLTRYNDKVAFSTTNVIGAYAKAGVALDKFRGMELQSSKMNLAGDSSVKVMSAQIDILKERKASLVTLQSSGVKTQEEVRGVELQINNLLIQRRDTLKKNAEAYASAEKARLSGIKQEQEAMGAMETLRGNWIEKNKQAHMKALDDIMAKEAEWQRKKDAAQKSQTESYMPGTVSGTGMSTDDKSLVKNQQMAESFTSSMGQLTSQVEGLGSLTDAFQTLTLAASGFGDTASSALQLTSVGLNGFAGMLKMSSNGALSEINAQIQMEQKRDGKSKESLAKIKQLEAKKIKEQQKAAQKQILISTAVAVMNAAATAPFLPLGLTMMATAAAAGGMALSQASSASSNQMAGLNVDSATSAASLSMGERSNKVNVAGSANSGELSYIRGDKGMGSIGSFTPRAEGGSMSPGMGYIVGENGPEVISPVQKMQATSNNDATNSGSSNERGHTFNISVSTMDAQSFDDNGDKIFDAFRHQAEMQGMDIFKLR